MHSPFLAASGAMGCGGLAELEPDAKAVDRVNQVEAVLDEHNDGVVALRLGNHNYAPQADVGHIDDVPKHPLLHISQGHQYLAYDIEGKNGRIKENLSLINLHPRSDGSSLNL